MDKPGSQLISSLCMLSHTAGELVLPNDIHRFCAISRIDAMIPNWELTLL
jgi:hypothetical protein